MAFASTVTEQGVMGDKKYSRGTYTNGSGDSGGDIDTGLAICQELYMQPTGAAVIASHPSLNEDLPVAGSAVTVVNTASEDGNWLAFGY